MSEKDRQAERVDRVVLMLREEMERVKHRADMHKYRGDMSAEESAEYKATYRALSAAEQLVLDRLLGGYYWIGY